MRPILCIDPGTSTSALFHQQSGGHDRIGKLDNPAVSLVCFGAGVVAHLLVIEDIQNMGLRVGKEVFRTAMWIGRFIERHGGEHVLMPRTTVKMELCGTTRAKDADIRQAIKNILGEPPTKKAPNPAYPKKPAKDEWSALAIALTYRKLEREGRLGDLKPMEG